MDFSPAGEDRVRPRVLYEEGGTRHEELVRCEKFVLERLTLESSGAVLEGEGRFRILSVIAGEGYLEHDGRRRPLGLGQSLLIPAALARVSVGTDARLTALHAYLP